jgi:phosphoribosylanthranilate isomerase
MKIKICGLTRECDIGFVNEALPDYAGFVFAESKRKVTEDQALALKRGLNPSIKAVGVFANNDISFVISLLERGIIDIVQLHGYENDEYILSIDAPVIKAVRIGERIDYKVDYLLFDNPRAGSGKTFDWRLIPKTLKPFFLAGGISIGNIDEAMKINPFAIDVSSGVEIDGVKDREKIHEIVKRVKTLEQQIRDTAAI